MKKKILIIDDSALMRRVFCDIINSDDRFEVVNTATDGAEGFKFICEKEYDAVVLDVYMPRMTGIQMLQDIGRTCRLSQGKPYRGLHCTCEGFQGNKDGERHIRFMTRRVRYATVAPTMSPKHTPTRMSPT